MLKKTVHSRGKRKLGYFIEQDNGIVLYVALRSHAQISRKRGESISDARRKGGAGWTLDMDTLMKCREQGVRYVAIKIRRKKHLWITNFAKFRDTSRAKLVNEGKRICRMLPFTEFIETQTEYRI